MFSNKTQKLLALQNDYIERINKNAVKLDKQLNFLMEIQNHLNKQVGGSTLLEQQKEREKQQRKDDADRRAAAKSTQGRIVGEYKGRHTGLQKQIEQNRQLIDAALIQQFEALPQPSQTVTEANLTSLKTLYNKILESKKQSQRSSGQAVSPRPDSPTPEEFVGPRGDPIERTPLPSTTVETGATGATGATDGPAETAEAARERRRRALQQSAQDTGAESLAIQRMQPNVESGTTADGPSAADRLRQAGQTVATEQAVVSAIKGSMGDNVTPFQESQAYNELMVGLMSAQEEQNKKLEESLAGLQTAITDMQEASKERVEKMAQMLASSRDLAKTVSMEGISSEQKEAIKGQLEAIKAGDVTLSEAVTTLFGKKQN